MSPSTEQSDQPAIVTMLVTDLRSGRMLHHHDFPIDRALAKALTTTLPATGYADGPERYAVEVRYEISS